LAKVVIRSQKVVEKRSEDVILSVSEESAFCGIKHLRDSSSPFGGVYPEPPHFVRGRSQAEGERAQGRLCGSSE